MPRFSLFESPALRRFLPPIADAFDTEQVKEHLAKVLFDPGNKQFTIHECELSQATFVPGECCILRYGLDILHQETGRTSRALVTGRLLPDEPACNRYTGRLAPLTALAAGRGELVPFTHPVGVIVPLRMVVSAFPIDGEMPTLIEATDPLRMAEILGAMPHACRIELVDYGRQHRVTLRYETGRVIYGKLATDGSGALAGPVTDRLRERVQQSGTFFHIPESLGWVPELRLSLLRAIPGRPGLERALKARLRGKPPLTDELSLEAMVDICAAMAAVVHGSGLQLGSRRTLDGEFLWCSRWTEEVRKFSPGLAGQLAPWLARVAAAAGLPALDGGLCHGDFTTGQALFDRGQSGLVDFDSVCQGEPALDIGQFLAYLRLGAMKTATARPEALADVLSQRFLAAYMDASRDGIDAEKLAERVAAYRIVSLLRRSIRSWQKFKPERVQAALTALARDTGSGGIEQSE